LTIDNRIINQSFESGALSPWIGFNASVTNINSHSGTYTTRLLGNTTNSFIYQYASISPEENFEFLASLTKLGIASSPPITIAIEYFDSSFIFLGYGLILNIPTNHLPDNTNNVWTEVYEITTPAPSTATKALVLINKLPQAGSADVLVDDVELLTITDRGSPGSVMITPTVQRYFYVTNLDIQAAEEIPADQFRNDDGESTTEFPSLGQNSYSNLYVNGLLQEGSLYSVSTSALTINPSGSIIFSGTPITLEIVQFFAQITPQKMG
jgi:hypothetical protein